MRKLYLAFSLVVVLTLAFLTGTSAQVPVTVTMTAGNNSGQDGTATLTPVGVQTEVVLNIVGVPGVAQPVHIHEGRCPDVGAVVFPLSDVINGMSSTMVNAPLDQLLSGNLAINVHKSAAEAGIFVSCGDIPAMVP